MRSIRRALRRCIGTSRVAALIAFCALSAFATGVHAQIAPPGGLPDKGQLRLQMGTSVEPGPGLVGHAPRRFVHVAPEMDLTNNGLQQTIGVTNKCILAFGGPYSLVGMTSTGGNGSGDIGVGPDSLGVPNGPKGVACYRFTDTKNEVIEFSLGADTNDPNLIDANAFYRLELDIEVKKNALMFLEVLIGGSVSAIYELRTGSNIDPADPDASSEPGAKVWNCNAQSDSGSDAGRNDNCRWIINELGQGFRLWAAIGEGSWEGGGDFIGDAFDNNSVIYLTEAQDIGVLGCIGGAGGNAPGGTDTSTIGDGISDAQCAVTRLDPCLEDDTDDCVVTCEADIAYVFRTLDGAAVEGCELTKFDDEQQLAASVEICFPPEESMPLGFDSPKTEILFVNPFPPFTPVSFTPERCDGTVVTDSNGNRIIEEVLDDPTTYDQIDDPDPTVSFPEDRVEFACILDNSQEYLGPAGDDSEMQVCQTILFWGDIQWRR